jgi:hypothetical protein
MQVQLLHSLTFQLHDINRSRHNQQKAADLDPIHQRGLERIPSDGILFQLGVDFECECIDPAVRCFPSIELRLCQHFLYGLIVRLDGKQKIGQQLSTLG